MNLRIRNFNTTDIEFAQEQTRREGWGADPLLLRTVLAHDPSGCFLAESADQPVGMVTTTLFSRSGWIGHLIVLPQHRRTGIGARLLSAALNYLEENGVSTVFLDADPPGVGLYRRLGFQDEFESLRYRRDPAPFQSPAPIRPIRPVDLPRVADLDEAAIGDRRDRFLSLLLHEGAEAFSVGDGPSVEGYLMVQQREGGLRIGPWVAATPQHAETLLQAAVALHPNETIVVGPPAPNPHAKALLQAAGFHLTPSSLRMRLGPVAPPLQSAMVYSIASGATG